MGQNWARYAPFTPTLIGSSSDPTLGTGSTAAGYYRTDGQRVWGYASVAFGSSGSDAGSGFYGFSLPVEPYNRTQSIGAGYLVDQSDNARLVLAQAVIIPELFATNLSRAVFVISNAEGHGFLDGNNPAGAACPFAWSANDSITISFDYEAA